METEVQRRRCPVDSVEFTVPWVRGKDRPRFTRSGRVYTDGKTERAQDEIAWLFRRVLEARDREDGSPAFGGDPVAVSINAYCPLPKSRPKRVESEDYTVKPDADNVAKLVLDALNGVAWEDDTQVVSLTVRKLPRTRLIDGERMDVRVSRMRSERREGKR